MYTYRASEDGLAAHRSLALVRTKIGAAGLRPTRPRFESVFFMKHQGDQRGRHHPKTPSALEREKEGGMTTHARPILERR